MAVMLTDRPRLKYRHELKYYVNLHQYHLISRRLAGVVQRDKNAEENGEYPIRSLYFDDVNNKALHDKLAGTINRAKYRIRTYNRTGDVIHLEKKIKHDSYIAKKKVRLTMEQYRAMLNGDYEALYNPDVPLLMDVYDQMKNRLLRPKVIVEYTREAFTAETGNVRITFDKNLKTGLNGVDLFDDKVAMVSALDERQYILEVKYDEYLPHHIRNLLQIDGLVRQSASKYVICLKWLKTNMWEDQ